MTFVAIITRISHKTIKRFIPHEQTSQLENTRERKIIETLLDVRIQKTVTSQRLNNNCNSKDRANHNKKRKLLHVYSIEFTLWVGTPVVSRVEEKTKFRINRLILVCYLKRFFTSLKLVKIGDSELKRLY